VSELVHIKHHDFHHLSVLLGFILKIGLDVILEKPKNVTFLRTSSSISTIISKFVSCTSDERH
jgi:hypothetical protein